MERVKRKTRDGVFAYRTQMGRRWGVDFRDPATRRRKRRAGFVSRELALRWKAENERQLLGLAPKQSTVLFRDAVTRYLEHRQDEGKSIRSYYHLVITSKQGERPGFWVQAFGKRRIAEVTSDQIEDVLRDATRKHRWSAATHNRALAQLSGLFTYARRRRWVEEHPVERGRIPRLREDNARTRWLRLHEVDAVLEASPEWLAVTVRFAVATGMRMGEICSLTRASFQRDSRDRAYLITERTKNGERLFWPLEGWPREYVEQRVKSTRFPGEYLFPGPHGGHAETSIRRTLPGVVKKAGLRFGRKHVDGVTFHSFRHSMASLALNNGVPESTVQAMGNWKTRAMVARYAHLADETLREGAATLARLMDEPRRKKRGRRGCVESA